MSKEGIILTIAIPTYNRPEEVQKQVRLLLPQLTSNVKLIVRDNCSPYALEALFSNEELEQFVIEHNMVNIGADANIARCFELCDTKWLWTLSDDDFVSMQALHIVLNNIEKYADSSWINFATSKNIKLHGFHEFSKDLNSLSSFGDSFWLSKCVYNLDELKPFIYWYYKNLSAMIGSLIMLLKYSKQCPEAGLVRLSVDIFEYCTPYSSWKHEEYIRYTGIIFDAFDHQDRKILKKNVLKVLTRLHLYVLSFEMNDAKYMFKQIIVRYGIIGSFYYAFILMLKRILTLYLPVKVVTVMLNLKNKHF